MRKIYLLLSFLSLAYTGIAQQRSQYTQYMMNNYLLNPALTGIEDYTDIKLGNRQQWVGLEGAPVTYYITAHMPLNKEASVVRGRAGKTGGARKINQNRFIKPYPHHGLGIMALTDKTGPLRRTNLNLSYAYHLPLNNNLNISTGVYGGLLQNSFNPGEATFVNPDDQVITNNFVNYAYFDTGVGTWLYSQDFFIGLAGTQLLKSRRDLNPNGSNIGGSLQPHFFATGGFKIRATPSLTLIPSTLIKVARPSPVSVDLNLKAVYADRVWVGGSYRTQDAFAAMVGFNLSYLMELGYSYDLNSTNLNVSHSGTHEIVVGFKLFNRAKVICPHWLQ